MMTFHSVCVPFGQNKHTNKHKQKQRHTHTQTHTQDATTRRAQKTDQSERKQPHNTHHATPHTHQNRSAKNKNKTKIKQQKREREREREREKDMGVRELKLCVKVLNIDIESDEVHVIWEIMLICYFTDPTLRGVPAQDGGEDRLFTGSNLTRPGSAKKRGVRGRGRRAREEDTEPLGKGGQAVHHFRCSVH